MNPYYAIPPPTQINVGSLKILVTTIDGAEIELQFPQELQAFGGRVQTLHVSHLKPRVAVHLSIVLQQTSMPMLRELKIDCEFAGEPLATPMLFNLPAPQYPSLERVTLFSAAVALNPALASQLRDLTMHCGLGPRPLLSLSSFLDCLPSFSCIESLHLVNCFRLPTGPASDVPPRPPRLNASRLTKISITDDPYTVGEIISSILVPAHAGVTLTADLDRIAPTPREAGALFLALRGRNPGCLPIVRTCKQVEVTSALYQCDYTGGTFVDPEWLSTPYVNMDFPNCFSGEDTAEARAFRARLFRFFIDNLGNLFRGAPVTHLKFCGDLSVVSPETWGNALAHFPTVRDLSISDETLRNSPLHVISALSERRSPALLCPNLESLELYGDIRNLHELEQIHTCLQSRQELGRAAVLRNLKVTLYSDAPFPEQFLERYRRGFRQLARQSSLEVKVMPGKRVYRDE